ncbi:MAG TPA: TetR family transcriptional regulator, partial [Acidimicrobiales bacterium]|nr:TetR family transcriptional regulator [Acidimicrobiales bacterium]
MDGRVLRGEINRQAIVDAFLGLVAEDGAVPTAQAVAQRAGVAKRSVFHHFVDMAALMRAAAEVQDPRHWN